MLLKVDIENWQYFARVTEDAPPEIRWRLNYPISQNSLSLIKNSCIVGSPVSRSRIPFSSDYVHFYPFWGFISLFGDLCWWQVLVLWTRIESVIWTNRSQQIRSSSQLTCGTVNFFANLYPFLGLHIKRFSNQFRYLFFLHLLRISALLIIFHYSTVSDHRLYALPSRKPHDLNDYLYLAFSVLKKGNEVLWSHKPQYYATKKKKKKVKSYYTWTYSVEEIPAESPPPPLRVFENVIFCLPVVNFCSFSSQI